MPPIYLGRVDHSDLYGLSDDYYSFRTLSVDRDMPFYRSTYPPCRDFSNSPAMGESGLARWESGRDTGNVRTRQSPLRHIDEKLFN